MVENGKHGLGLGRDERGRDAQWTRYTAFCKMASVRSESEAEGRQVVEDSRHGLSLTGKDGESAWLWR